MKKLFLSVLMLSALTACKKETATTITATADNTAVTKASPTQNPAASLQEMTAAKVSELVKPKQNDTVYVTNFFATWCGPCMMEIPHFKEKMQELKGQPVKFTFVSLDNKADWPDAVKNFAEEENLTQNIVLLDASQLAPDYFTQNFQTWDGGSIPFTLITKGDQRKETVGSMTRETLDAQMNSFLATSR